MKARISIVSSLMILALFTVFSCRPKPSPHGDELRLVVPANLRSLDPALAEDEISSTLVAQIYETPLQYQYHSESLESLEPLLLEELPILADGGKSVTLKFRKQARYHNNPCFTQSQGQGRAIEARDLVLAIQRLMDPVTQSNGFWTFANRLVGDREFLKAVRNTPFTDWPSRLELYDAHPISGLQLVDAHTLKMQFHLPYPQLPFVLAMPMLSPIPPEALRHYGMEFANNPVGSGPYQLVSWQNGSRITLHRAATYWGSRPKFETVHFEVLLESQPQWLRFMNNELDILRIPKDNYDQAIGADLQVTAELANRGIQLVNRVQPTTWFLGFNMKDAQVGDDLKLREAMALAYDSERRIRILTNNRAQRATSILPPGLPGFEETSLPAPNRDLERAKALLSESKYAKLKKPAVLQFDLRGTSTNFRQWGEFFKRDMQELGVPVQVNLNPFAEYVEKEKHGRLQVFMGGWIADYPDPENFLQLLYGGNLPPGPNATQFDDPEYNRLFRRLQETTDSSARLELVKALVEIVHTQKPWVEDFYSAQYDLVQPWVKNYRIHPFCKNFVKYLKN